MSAIFRYFTTTMAMDIIFGLISVFICVVISGVSGETCSQYNDIPLYCPYDCCGTKYNRYCCNNDAVVNAISSVAITGIVIGVIILVSIIVSVIVCIFCCLRKSRGSTGQVVGQAGAHNTTVVTSASPYPTGPQQQIVYNPGQAAYPVQPAYPGQSPYPAQPAYNPTQPAYNLGPQPYNADQTGYKAMEQPPPYQPN